MDKFQLTEEEQNILKSGDVTLDFFKTLQRVRVIHEDCKVLLRTQHQRAGYISSSKLICHLGSRSNVNSQIRLEIMDSMSNIQEQAFRRLYKWLKDECSRFENPMPMVTPLMKEALDTLKDRPMLVTYCLEEVSRVRAKFVSQSFIISLTQGGPGG